MFFQIGFEKSISFIKLSAYLACTWPPPSSATKWQIIRYNIRWCILFVNTAWIFFGLVFSAYEHSRNTLIITQSVCFAGAATALMIRMIAYRIRLKPTQTRIEEMENFLKTATTQEKTILRRYSEKFSMIHVFYCLFGYLASSTGIFQLLLFHDQPLLFTVVYPFPVDSGVTRILIIIQQCVGAFQSSAGIASICQAALLLWFAGARLEILAAEAKSILKTKELPNFVEKHKNRLAYAEDVSISMRYVALSTSLVSGLVAIVSSVLLVSNQPLAHKMRFVPLTVVALVNLFVCAWPADNLINVCHSLGNAVYNISWLDMPVRTRKNLIVIIQRCQRPITVFVGGLLPTLSLRSYAAYLAAVYSYFTTLRAVVADGAK